MMNKNIVGAVVWQDMQTKYRQKLNPVPKTKERLGERKGKRITITILADERLGGNSNDIKIACSFLLLHDVWYSLGP
jgi:hypothetical protein